MSDKKIARSTKIFSYCWHFILLVALLSVFVLIKPAYADSLSGAHDDTVEKKESFRTPMSLIEHPVSNIEDVNAIMVSDKFEREVFDLAQTLYKSASKVKNKEISHDLSERQKLGLASILGHHQQVLDVIKTTSNPLDSYHYQAHAWANLTSESSKTPLNLQLLQHLSEDLPKVSNESLYHINYTMSWSLSRGRDYMLYLLRNYQKHQDLSRSQALELVSNYQLYQVYESVKPIIHPIIDAEHNKRYVINTDLLIKTPDGARISAVMVRNRGDAVKRPTALRFTIYADEKTSIQRAVHAAAHGYVGVVAYTRGKGKSPDNIVPWEHDGKDANAVIDWISKQAWNDGRVVMYGGSYVGFTQWAAAKYHHPALKTIIPIEAAHPFVGLPVENNIFITPNYQWAFHVTNNKTMDHSVYEDWQHWNQAHLKLFTSGRAYRDIDQVEGTPNPWLQKWLKHSSYDRYYQAMLPYQDDFKNINIPVLSITGYFGASISAQYFFDQHYQYNPQANHTLLTGPYDHGTAQTKPNAYYSNYKLDPVALEKDTQELAFEWFDHILYKKAKPKLLKDKVNYQLMGSNTWQHAPSMQSLHQDAVTFFLTNKLSMASTKPNKKAGDYSFETYQLATTQDKTLNYVNQTVDLSNREEQHHAASWRVINQKLESPNGIVFLSEPFQHAQAFAGSIKGHFSIAINKKDVDIGFKLYEVKPNGETFKLGRYIGRASYAEDMGKRQLLKPGVKTKVSIVNSVMTAKLIGKGSRLALIVNVNKNPGAQVNMGTGKDVSEETIEDAGEPLQIKWFNDSQFKVPLTRFELEDEKNSGN
jgi:uncharacterized protein